jgi:hypothetical protein
MLQVGSYHWAIEALINYSKTKEEKSMNGPFSVRQLYSDFAVIGTTAVIYLGSRPILKSMVRLTSLPLLPFLSSTAPL